VGSSPMRVLSVRQPWATAIARWEKPVENRTWLTAYRGPIAIHAASSWDRSGESAPACLDAYARLSGAQEDQILSTRLRGRLDSEDQALFPRKALVAVGLLSGCHQCSSGSCSPWAAAGQWHWELSDIRALPEPIPALGQQGLWKLPSTLAAAALVQLLPEARLG
jgi:hypothetical protein